MLLESDIIPYHVSPPPGERVLVLAPHPDDESLGCGGIIRLLLEAKKDVRVVFLTSGDKAELCRQTVCASSGHITQSSGYALMREKEAEKALRILGVSDYLFLRFPDRGLYDVYHEVLQRVSDAADEFKPDTLYSPSVVELHPDHRAAADIALEIQRTMKSTFVPNGRPLPVSIVFYEIALPLRPNLLVDVTSVYRRKIRAVKKYKSQLKIRDYLGCITALNTFRALTVEGPRYIEALWLVDTPLSEEERERWLGYRQSL
jgi:LmbE family N-acetylglucosaminyl deacetylase